MSQENSTRAGHTRAAGILPFFVIVAIYAICMILVHPKGEFPLDDDWSYTRSAFRLGTENRMAVDEFSAPSLVGQALYGGLLVKAFGKSFLALRLSTLLLSCATACVLWRLLRWMRAKPGLAWVGVLSWVFNPIQFWLSFTYMTEIPFLFAVSVAVLAFARYLATQKTWPLAVCGAALGYAFLIRQTSVLFIAAAGLCLLLEKTRGGGLRRKIAGLSVWASCIAVFVAAYYVLAPGLGGATPAARRKFELLRYLSTEQITGNFFGSLFYLSFFLLPLLACLVPSLRAWFRLPGGGRRLGLLAGWILISAFGLWWFHSRFSGFPYLPARAFHAQMPFLLNIMFDTGLGPLTLDPTYYGSPPIPVHPGIWSGVTLLAGAGLVVLGVLCTRGFAGLRSSVGRPELNLMALFWGASAAAALAFEVVFSHLQEGGLFDRHILTTAFPIYLALCLFAGSNNRPERENGLFEPHAPPGLTGRRVFAGLSVALLAGLAYFCITATHDYFAWNRLRWELGNELLAEKVDPLFVSGGFEFNAWHNYDTFRARGHIDKVYYWWYDRLDYLITMEPQEDYRVVKKLEYYSWLNRRSLPVYLLQKN